MTAKTNGGEEKLTEVVIILDNHRHAGKQVKKGSKVKVTATVKAFMIENKIIKG